MRLCIYFKNALGGGQLAMKKELLPHFHTQKGNLTYPTALITFIPLPLLLNLISWPSDASRLCGRLSN